METMFKIPLTSGDPDPRFVGGPFKMPADTIRKTLRINDTRKINPATGQPFKQAGSKSIDADVDTVRDIIRHAKGKGVDPYEALAIAYQESNIDREHPYHLRVSEYGNKYGTPETGVQSIVSQMQYANDLIRKGKIPNTDEYRLQGYNGYGRIYEEHPDLEGSKSIYGIPIPDQGINLLHNPLYGKTVKSLRDEVLKKHPEIVKMVNETPAYQYPIRLKVKK